MHIYFARGLNVTKAIPAMQPMAFWEPPTTASNFHLSTNNGTAATDTTASIPIKQLYLKNKYYNTKYKKVAKKIRQSQKKITKSIYRWQRSPKPSNGCNTVVIVSA